MCFIINRLWYVVVASIVLNLLLKSISGGYQLSRTRLLVGFILVRLTRLQSFDGNWTYLQNNSAGFDRSSVVSVWGGDTWDVGKARAE